MKITKTLPSTFALFAATAAAAGAVDYRAVAAAHGGSLTSPRLRSDVMARLQPTIAAMDHCEAVIVQSRTVVRFVDSHSPWRERWLVSDCGHVRPVTLTFTPTPDGGADFAVSMKR